MVGRSRVERRSLGVFRGGEDRFSRVYKRETRYHRACTTERQGLADKMSFNFPNSMIRMKVDLFKAGPRGNGHSYAQTSVYQMGGVEIFFWVARGGSGAEKAGQNGLFLARLDSVGTFLSRPAGGEDGCPPTLSGRRFFVEYLV